MIAISLSVFLLGALLTFLWQAVDIRDQVSARIDRGLLARQTLQRIADELRGCVGFDEVGFPVEQRLVGERRKLAFLTTVLPDDDQYKLYRASEELPPARHDLTQVSYELWVDPENYDDDEQPIVGGIVRKEKKTLNQFLVDEEDQDKLRTDLWSSELGYLEFRYFDGREWDTKWDITEGNSLPQLVLVTVGFKNVNREEWEDADLEEFPLSEYPLGDDLVRGDRYSIIVRLPAADHFFSTRVQRVGKQFSEQLGLEGAGGLAP